MAEWEGVIGYFNSPDSLREAARKAREAYFRDTEAYLPLEDPETLEEFLPGSSPMRWTALLGGIAGLAAGLGMAIWTSLDYPLVTGGMPIVALPPFLVTAFELMILGAAVGAVAAFLWRARLPSLVPSPAYGSDLAVDTCALLIRCRPQAGSRARAERILREAGALEVRPVHRTERGYLGDAP